MSTLEYNFKRELKTKIVIGEDTLYSLGVLVKSTLENVEKALITTTKPVDEYYGSTAIKSLEVQEVKTCKYILPCGEEAKQFTDIIKLYEQMITFNIGRNDLIVGLGGGSLLDTTGFVASTYMRGIPLVTVPSTLLSMVDAGIGGKNAINHSRVKNVIGTFYLPRLTIIDPRLLLTLPEREYRSGFAELVKYGVIMDKELFNTIHVRGEDLLSRDLKVLREVIRAGVRDKMEIVLKDLYEEKGVRQVLNFGHTVAHIIESLTDYRVSHGEAVAVGMVVESEISKKLGYTSSETVNTIKEVLASLKLPISPTRLSIPRLNTNSIVNIMFKDKKRVGNKIRTPILLGLGKSTVVELDFNTFIKAVVEELKGVLE